MRILITGGAGFIGSHLVEHFQGTAEVVVLDDLSTGRLQNLQGFDYRLVNGSICDRNAVREAMAGVDLVFHLAAMTSVAESMVRAVDCVQVNGVGTLVVLEEAARAQARKLCFSSSAAVYGDAPRGTAEEEMRPEPNSPYAVTKLDGEYYCAIFHRQGWLRTAALRYFNVFGQRQRPEGAYAAVIPAMVEAACDGRPLVIHGDGSQTRDFVCVQDVVAANCYLARHPELTGPFNVASGQTFSIAELARLVIQVTGASSEIVFGPRRAGDIRNSSASVAKLRAAGCPLSCDQKSQLTKALQEMTSARRTGLPPSAG